MQACCSVSGLLYLALQGAAHGRSSRLSPVKKALHINYAMPFLWIFS